MTIKGSAENMTIKGSARAKDSTLSHSPTQYDGFYGNGMWIVLFWGLLEMLTLMVWGTKGQTQRSCERSKYTL